jgi:hypothetical protein
MKMNLKEVGHWDVVLINRDEDMASDRILWTL